MAARVSDWQVLEDYTASYHQYVSFVKHEDRDFLLEAMVDAPPPANLNKIKNQAEAEALVGGTTRRVEEWCDAWMPKREAQHLWRLAQRHRTCEGARAAAATYKVAKKALVREIKVSKNRCWRELIAEKDKDTLGWGYQIALKRFRGSDLTPPMEPSLLERVVSCLFLENPARRRKDISVGQVPLFTLEELRSVASETPGHKAPGLDGVPSEVLKIIAAEKPHVMLDMFNACLRRRSTVVAVAEVLESAREAWKPSHKTRGVCVLATLDVRNAFNSAKWSDIIRALKRQNVPDYLRKILDSYLRNRVLWYDTKDGPKKRRLTSEVAQESALGPDLWNLDYDEFLRLKIEIWDHSFKLALGKTEMVVLTRQRWFGKNFHQSVAGEVICASPVVRYLGVWIDSRLNFREHIRRAANKVARICRAVSRLMPNVGGPREAKRRLLALVSNSILLYGTITCAYRMVSSTAAMVIARTIPVVLLAQKQRRKFLGSGDENDSDRREETLTTLQQEWGRAVHGQFDAYLHRMTVKTSPRCSYCPALDDTVEYTFFVCERWHRERQWLMNKIGVAPTPETIISEMLSSEEG
ncbi:uncharacterized protein LOC111643236 [Copidosoma floridanum]|uniref:uncharacterized protein LOC111643236 n=1 Tax=Copidosoma floridanum TaxID=29053 RepID=UPI000C6F9873|nr:uncharacterized protein LOC111643236 [Copidosoma floridanum]